MKFKIFSLVFGIIFNVLLCLTIINTALEQMSKKQDGAFYVGIAILAFISGIQVFVIFPIFGRLIKSIKTTK